MPGEPLRPIFVRIDGQEREVFDVASVRARLAEAAALDPDLLARALILVGLHSDASRPDWTAIARLVIAEYERLRAKAGSAS